MVLDFQKTMDKSMYWFHKHLGVLRLLLYITNPETLKANPDIDPDRVIIGGCSAGGKFNYGYDY